MPTKSYIKQTLGIPDTYFLPEEFDSSLLGYVLSRHARVNKRPIYSYRLYGKYIAGLNNLTAQQKVAKLNEFYAPHTTCPARDVFPLVVEKDPDAVVWIQKKHQELQLIPGDDMNRFIIGIGYLEHMPCSVVYDKDAVTERGYSFSKGGDPLDISESNPVVARHSPWLLVTCKIY